MPPKKPSSSPSSSSSHATDSGDAPRGRVEPFDIDTAIARVRRAVRPYPKAAMFELAERGHTSVFEQLVGCIISIRTRDETTLPAAEALFAEAPSPAAMAALDVDAIERAIHSSTFSESKAPRIQAIAQATVDDFGGELPADPDILQRFDGVGPKCANLAVGVASGRGSGRGGISVDVHVHRVTNRWGYVEASRPPQTMEALEERLPKDYWIEINALLVPFGKHICTGRRPKCSQCPVEPMCAQLGVEDPR